MACSGGASFANAFEYVCHCSSKLRTFVSTKSKWGIFARYYYWDIFRSFQVRDLYGNWLPQVQVLRCSVSWLSPKTRNLDLCFEDEKSCYVAWAIWGCVPSREQLVSGPGVFHLQMLNIMVEKFDSSHKNPKTKHVSLGCFLIGIQFGGFARSHSLKRTAPFSSPWLSSWPLLLFRARCMFTICRCWDKLVISSTKESMEQTITNSLLGSLPKGAVFFEFYTWLFDFF